MSPWGVGRGAMADGRQAKGEGGPVQPTPHAPRVPLLGLVGVAVAAFAEGAEDQLRIGGRPHRERSHLADGANRVPPRSRAQPMIAKSGPSPATAASCPRISPPGKVTS